MQDPNIEEINKILLRICNIKGYAYNSAVTCKTISNNTKNLEELKEILRVVLENNLSALALHESVLTSFGSVIMKVESGYIYDCWDLDTDSFKLGIFVPFKKK